MPNDFAIAQQGAAARARRMGMNPYDKSPDAQRLQAALALTERDGLAASAQIVRNNARGVYTDPVAKRWADELGVQQRNAQDEIIKQKLHTGEYELPDVAKSQIDNYNNQIAILNDENGAAATVPPEVREREIMRLKGNIAGIKRLNAKKRPPTVVEAIGNTLVSAFGEAGKKAAAALVADAKGGAQVIRGIADFLIPGQGQEAAKRPSPEEIQEEVNDILIEGGHNIKVTKGSAVWDALDPNTPFTDEKTGLPTTKSRQLNGATFIQTLPDGTRMKWKVDRLTGRYDVGQLATTQGERTKEAIRKDEAVAERDKERRQFAMDQQERSQAFTEKMDRFKLEIQIARDADKAAQRTEEQKAKAQENWKRRNLEYKQLLDDYVLRRKRLEAHYIGEYKASAKDGSFTLPGGEKPTEDQITRLAKEQTEKEMPADKYPPTLEEFEKQFQQQPAAQQAQAAPGAPVLGPDSELTQSGETVGEVRQAQQQAPQPAAQPGPVDLVGQEEDRNIAQSIAGMRAQAGQAAGQPAAAAGGAPKRRFSPDGKWEWNGTKWIPRGAN